MTTSPPTAPTTVSTQAQESAGRLVKALHTLHATVQHGLESGVAEPAQQVRWQKVAGLLEQDVAEASAALRSVQRENPAPLIKVGRKVALLARSMDGYALDFAGAELAERLVEERRLAVLAGWQAQQAGQTALEQTA